MFSNLVKRTRSFRRFKQEPAPSMSDLDSLVELARFAPSASNRQPIRYIIVKDSEVLPQVFSCLRWAGYLESWSGPKMDEQPTAYIVLLSDPTIDMNPGIDLGLAAQNVVLGAAERGFGACLVGSITRDHLREILDVPQDLKIEMVVALGAPGEQVVLTEAKNESDIRYWRGDDDVHYVPKRRLEDVVVKRV